MAGSTVTMPMQGSTSINPGSSQATNFQPQTRFPPPRGPADQGPRLDAGAQAPSFQRGGGYQFRPRFQNKNADDPMSGIMYDGKRMRKAIHRKTVDYNPSILKYLQVSHELS